MQNYCTRVCHMYLLPASPALQNVGSNVEIRVAVRLMITYLYCGLGQLPCQPFSRSQVQLDLPIVFMFSSDLTLMFLALAWCLISLVNMLSFSKILSCSFWCSHPFIVFTSSSFSLISSASIHRLHKHYVGRQNNLDEVREFLHL
ncbi:hypothetical protein RvY_08484-2 [Ramazzottius varieornatus]|uniref:Uncharacterized protein n=1 Tax=Ramazzottius varieornatus TaxID=947166 RepID=A0A1D1V601_RAMVA|nr:hypothetical protein RvY_08484-2 [Ramazzottius varieornatus]